MEISFSRIAELLKTARKIILTGHIHPDGDCLGSLLALYHALVARGKEVQMLIDDNIPVTYHFLPGIEQIARPVVETTCDVLVVLDASDAERIGRVAGMVKAPVINIDHHASNLKFADYWLLDNQAAATGELIFELLEELKCEITCDIAVCLYTAIATDCGFFRYANTTARTLRYAAFLIECGAQPHVISEYIETKPLTSIIALGQVLQTLEFYLDGKIASISIDRELGDSVQSTEGFINYPRTIEGVEVAIMFKADEENLIRISFRSKQVDVSKIALSFGGGGHVRAAGCTLAGTLAEVKASIVAAVSKEILESDV
ncbi:hypothetical protein P22_2224 [Propionispora sp. 2/2-37]|uniref:DHH family phosphoesterase n=1 Tax=Propionispora sp. 2/2-37 TaxID=1677858 RepID=UPI0006BB85B8|nr:bifunctional oligoribonuclease/PAP phosphatase NrnA [Propionispora sp. 2/2-37]CUH96136.1 hypothetical protein P22_2224 [Propionispora sp. 2/2-37]